MKLTSKILLAGILLATTLLAQISLAQYLPLPTGSISGTLIDKETGEPVAGCRVELYSISRFITLEYPPRQIPPRIVGSTYSSTNGNFTITTWYPFFGDSFYHIQIDDHKYQFEMFSGPVSKEVNDWGLLEVSKRPFYLENFSLQDNVVTATVVNNTGKRAYMRFWLTGRLTRLDDSDFFDCESSVQLQLKWGRGKTKNYATYRLNRGENEIRLPIKDYGSSCVISQIILSGGHSYSQPMMRPASASNGSFAPPPIISPPLIITNLPPFNITHPWPPVLVPRPLPPILAPQPWPPYTTFSGSVITRMDPDPVINTNWFQPIGVPTVTNRPPPSSFGAKGNNPSGTSISSPYIQRTLYPGEMTALTNRSFSSVPCVRTNRTDLSQTLRNSRTSKTSLSRLKKALRNLLKR